MDDYSPDKILTELNNEIYVIMRNSSIEIEITCEKIYVVNMTNSTEGKIQILIDQTLIDDNKGICNSYYAGIEKNETFCKSRSFNVSLSSYNFTGSTTFDVVCKIEDDSNTTFSIKLKKICKFEFKIFSGN